MMENTPGDNQERICSNQQPHESMELGVEKKIQLEIAHITDTGAVRERNEDAVGVFESSNLAERETLLILADGMGGHNAGEIASKIVVTEFAEVYFSQKGENKVNNLVQAVREINRRVYTSAEKMEGARGMGSTIVVCLVTDQHIVLANVGDSRAYLLREGSLRLLTKDHTLRHQLFDPFEKVWMNDLAHVLTMAIGPQPEVSPHVCVNRLCRGDVILLCSDGVSNVVPESEIGAILQGPSVSEDAKKLIAKATENGSDDNMSVIVLRVLG